MPLPRPGWEQRIFAQHGYNGDPKLLDQARECVQPGHRASTRVGGSVCHAGAHRGARTGYGLRRQSQVKKALQS